MGLGALGQNVVQNLALLGVGRLMLVDFDMFEDHNATRSPFYPTAAEAARFGLGKAVIVAHRAASIGTARDLRVYYSSSLVQVLGDGVVRWADLIVAAVDNLTARAWLAERCRLHGKPIVEGGAAVGGEYQPDVLPPFTSQEPFMSLAFQQRAERLDPHLRKAEGAA